MLKKQQPLNCLWCVSGGPYLSVAVVGVPAGPKALLPSYVPKQEVCVAHSYLLHVAANGGRCVDGFLRQTGGIGGNKKLKELNTQIKVHILKNNNQKADTHYW